MVQLILSCLRTARLALLWNGEQLEDFVPTRGIRQGDLLAPYLFVIAMEVLSQQIGSQMEKNEWRAIKLTRKGPAISHLMFADDLFLFGEASCPQAEVMQRTIQTFFVWSGQRVNVGKLMIYFSPNTRNGI